MHTVQQSVKRYLESASYSGSCIEDTHILGNLDDQKVLELFDIIEQ